MKKLLVLVAGGLLLVGGVAEASSPEAWTQHEREVRSRCLALSGLRNAQAVGEIVGFDDRVGYDALLVRGNYAQAQMNNQTGQVLCLFDRRTRRAYISDAENLMQPRRPQSP
ncbi:hypothetical protein [Leptolyngbya sp. FACHB-261]|uniref:hypothetical protein n=1 Tax=Leptolyngbya sp. FACHB-261 TaxID=2692806 RepID=UPI00168894AE|nr:hypothetical protein [Leptolyngbya sp. FACHB-261]MBD2104823.1 hypothetical protein [Leptolyngbya sp. FACHB-261]